MVIERARLAQRSGSIRAILFHQGESDSGRAEWVDEVAGMVADSRADLDLGTGVPFVAAELLYSGCCAGHNRLIAELPNAIPNAHVVAATRLAGMDNFHFDLAGMHELGERYAETILRLVPAPE